MNQDERLRGLIVELLASESGQAVTPGTPLGDGGLELTSLELVRLLVGIEERLDIELDDVDIMNAHFDTVDDIIGLVSEGRPG